MADNDNQSPDNSDEPFLTRAANQAKSDVATVKDFISNYLTQRPSYNLDTIDRAIHGDQDARLEVSQHSLGTAMGTLAPEGGGVQEATLPMDKASQLARAKEMGFDTSKTYYHGTRADIEKFDPNALGTSTNANSAKQGYFFASDPSTASDYAELSQPRAVLRSKAETGQVESYPEQDIEDLKKEINLVNSAIDLHMRENPSLIPKRIQQNKNLIEAYKQNEYMPVDLKKERIDDLNNQNSILEEIDQLSNQKAWDDKYNNLIKQRNEKEDKLVSYKENYLSGQNVIPVHLKMENPYIHDFEGSHYRDTSYSDIMKKAKEQGHDSVIFKNTYDPADPNNRVKQDIIAVFDPSQIRSVNASFDPSKAHLPNISYAQGGEVANNTGVPPGLDEFIAPEMAEEKYGTPGQQAIAAVEGAAKGLLGPIATGTERMLGVPGEDIQGRAEANPITHYGTELAGLAAPMILTAGAAAPERAALEGAGAGLEAITQAGVLSKVGEAASKAVGLGGEGAGALSKIGSAAVKSAAENAAFQLGDETSKLIMGDPNQSLGTAAVDVGLSGLLGAGIGAGIGSVNPLWQATMGPKTGGVLKAISQRLGGIEGVVPEEAENAIRASGMDLAPEIRAGLSDIPEVQQAFKTLEQSDTTRGGLKFQEAFKTFRKDTQDALVKAFGKTTDELPEEISQYEHGKKLGETLADEYKEKLNPIAEKFDQIREKYSNEALEPSTAEKSVAMQKDLNSAAKAVEKASGQVLRAQAANSPEKAVQAMAALEEAQGNLNAVKNRIAAPGTADKIMQGLGQLAEREGWYGPLPTEITAQLNKVMQAVPKIKTANDISTIIEAVGKNMQSNPLDGELRRAGSLIKGVLKEHEADFIGNRVGSMEGEEAVKAYKEARAAYKIQSDLKEALDSRLHLRGSTSSYGKRLSEMARTDGETLLRRLSGKGDADLISVLQKNFPRTAEALKDYHINDLLYKASQKAKGDDSLNSRALIKAVEGLSPELRDFILSPESASKVKAISTLLDKFDALPHNFSNTARTWDKLNKYGPSAAMAMVSMLTGHNPAIGFIIGGLTKYLAKDAPDAARLALLKFLGSNKPIDAAGFKTMFDFIHATSKGENTISKATKALFTAGKEVLPSSLMPSERERDKLDSLLKDMRSNPQSMADIGGNINHYMPEHGMALGQTAANAINFLNSARPNTDRKSPLDSKPVLSAEQKSQYNRLLDIAQQPLVVMNSIKNGTVTAKDVAAIKTMYPGLYSRLSEKLSTKMIESVSKGHDIPYATRLGLSTFMGQPMDSTISPNSIMAAQQTYMQNAQQNQPVPKPAGKSMKALNQLSTVYQTPNQASESRHISHK